jgi:hypothetical protein
MTLALVAWVVLGTLGVRAALAPPPAAAPASIGPLASAQSELLSSVNVARKARGVQPVEFDPRLAMLLQEQGAGRLSLTALLDRLGTMCDSSRWVVVASPLGEPLPVVLRDRVESLIGTDYTSGAVDQLLDPGEGEGSTYRVVLCHPVS